MRSGGPWNLRGLRPEARAAAREAARASGMSVGEWLNTVIRPTDEDDDAWWSGDFDHASQVRRRPRLRDDERERDSDHDRSRDAPPPRRQHERVPEDRWRENSDYEQRERDFDDRQRQRSRYESRHRERDDRRRDDERERGRLHNSPPPRRRHDRSENDDRSLRPEGRPYRDEHRARFRRERPHDDAAAPAGRHDRMAGAGRPSEPDRDASINRAVAEIEARQRMLDSRAAAEVGARRQAVDNQAAADSEAGERIPDSATPPQRSFGEREPQPLPARPDEGGSGGGDAMPAASHAVAQSHDAAIDIDGLHRQLREITTRIEALRPSVELETALNGLRGDLAEVRRSLTEALPQRALDSLESEIKALAQRIDQSRQNGVDSGALAGVERGLAEVNETLRALQPAESLVGFDETVKTLTKKIDDVVVRDDPTALQQLEASIGALRGIVSHVASNETLNKVAEDVRALTAKVDGLASAPSSLSSLEDRIDGLTNALKTSTEAGHAVPRELDKLLSGLIEKLEWVQLTHTDHTALAHLEDRIASLVKRLDASDARLGMLEGVERGLADILVYIEQLRAAGGIAPARPVAAEAIKHDVAAIKETERRTQDSLEDVHGTVEHVVDRLAMIESDMRLDKVGDTPAKPLAPAAQEPKPTPVEPLPTDALMEAPPTEWPPTETPPTETLSTETLPTETLPTEAFSAAPASAAERAPAPDAPTPQTANAHLPIDPSLPPDHPLEPGSAVRARQQPSAADRIAASEAAIGSKPPVIPDPGGKSDFIAAARRAAKAAAAASTTDKSSAKAGARESAAPPKTLSDRLRTLAVAAAVVAIIVGGLHIVSRVFLDGGSNAPPQAQTQPPRLQPQPPKVLTESPRPQAEIPAQTEPSPAQMELPQVRGDPSVPATVPPASPTPLPKVISVPPHADAAPTPAPIAPSDSPNGPEPGQQSQATPMPSAAVAVTTANSDEGQAQPAAPAAAAVGPPIDITGSLPNTAANP